MKKYTSVMRIVVICVLCTSLCMVPSFGPRLLAFSLEFPTKEIPLELEPLSPSAETLSSGEQVKNILSVISLTYSNVLEVRFQMWQVPYTDVVDTQFMFYDYNEVDADIISFTDTIDSNGRLEILYKPNGETSSGVPFLYCGYNTTDDVALAKQAIQHSIGYGELSNDLTINSADNFYLTNTKILIGDVNDDNLINSMDSSLISAATTNPSSLSQYEFLAADVNGDGAVTPQDTLAVMKYVDGTLDSFWETESLVTLTLSSTLQNDNIYNYRLFNKGSGEYLIANNADGIGMDSSPNSIETNLLDIDNPNNLFVIRNPLTGSYLAVDWYNNAYQIWFTDTPQNQSQYWYIVEKTNGYYLVNFAYQDRVLSDDLTLKRTLHNAAWDIQPITVNINYYFDNCYYARFSNNYITTTSSLVEYQDDVRDIFSEVFGIKVTTTMPQLMQSYSDMCYSGAITANNVNNRCTHGGGDTKTGHDNCLAYNGNSGSPPASGDIHHNNDVANLYHLRQQKQSSTPVDIQFLMSGHFGCGMAIDETGHEYSNVGGIANIGYRVAVVFNDNPDILFYKLFTTLHEISHCLGAGSAPGSKADTYVKDGHPNCIMAYGRNEGILNTAWNEGNYNELFCFFCKAEMKTYIMMNYR